MNICFVIFFERLLIKDICCSKRLLYNNWWWHLPAYLPRTNLARVCGFSLNSAICFGIFHFFDFLGTFFRCFSWLLNGQLCSVVYSSIIMFLAILPETIKKPLLGDCTTKNWVWLNAMWYKCSIQHLFKQKITSSYGFRLMRGRWPQIVFWALYALQKVIIFTNSSKLIWPSPLTSTSSIITAACCKWSLY